MAGAQGLSDHIGGGGRWGAQLFNYVSSDPQLGSEPLQVQAPVWPTTGRGGSCLEGQRPISPDPPPPPQGGCVGGGAQAALC